MLLKKCDSTSIMLRIARSSLIPLVICLHDLIQKFLRQLIIEAVLLLDERPDIKDSAAPHSRYTDCA